jgi:AAA ATPase containing von Willebrand factor type A (vWA) domain
MKKITTVFYVFAVLALFVLMTGCGSSKKETVEGDTLTDVDNDIAADGDVDADADDTDETEDADSENTEPGDDDDTISDAESVSDDNDIDSKPEEDICATFNELCITMNNMWSPRSPDQMLITDASPYCRNLTAYGFDDWRLPTISELRTLIQNCPNTETGGQCELTDSCSDYKECWTKSDCFSDFCPSGGDYSKFGDTGWYWSSSGYQPPSAEIDDRGSAYGVNFSDATMANTIGWVPMNVRCIRKIDGYNENVGCSALEGKMWSSEKSAYLMSHKSVAEACDNLTECGFSDWHLPTISELRTLIRNCDSTATGGECGVTDECLSKKDCWAQNVCSSCPRDASGKYSKLGDNGLFLSSSVSSDYSNESYHYHVDFLYGNVYSKSANHDEYFYRCVRKYSEDEISDEGCMSGKDKCINSQSLHCEDSFWIPEEYCDYTCDPSTGKCLEAECVSDEYSCGEGNPSTKSRYCKKGHWKIKNCEGECEPSTGRCKDVCHNVEGKMWSPLATETIYDANMNWQNATNYCENLTACGYSDWHLPTINELRTLIQNCSETETGGACGVTDSCLESDCYTSSDCAPNNYVIMNGYFSKLGDAKILWSSSNYLNSSAWIADFRSGGIFSSSKSSFDSKYVRCVR